MLILPKAAEPKAAEPKAAEPKAPELSKEAQLRLQEAREAQAQRLEEQERSDMLLRPILACLPQPSLQWQRRKLWFSCTNAASPEGKQLAYNAMAKALAKEPTVPKTETPVKAMPVLPPWRQPPLPPSISECVCRAHGKPAPWNAGTCTWITNAPTGQSSEFGDLWESWAKDAPCCCFSACAKGT